jgi:cobalt-zinc-cadmium resistance protein CzcA
VRDGPAQIIRETGKRRIVVGINVADRDLGGFVAELQQKVGQEVQLPEELLLRVGRPVPEHGTRARPPDHHRADHVGAIFFLLFLLFGSLRFATLIITVLPFASIGGVIGLFISGEYLSVPASVGFIALWGIAVLNGVVLVSYIRKLRNEGMELMQAVVARCEDALPAGDDDGDRGDAGPDPVPVRDRAGFGSAATARHRGDRRPDHLHAAHAGRGAGPLHMV